MRYILLNLEPILAATIAGLALGLLWWWALPGPRLGRARFVLTAVVAEFWLCCILAGALILAPAKAGRWTMALMSAIVIWIGFVAPAVLTTNAYREGPPAAGLTDAARWLIVMLAQAVVLNWMGLVKPA